MGHNENAHDRYVATVNWGNTAQFSPLQPTDIHIWRIDLRQLPRVVNTQTQQILTQDEIDRANRFVFDRHRRRFTVCRGALRHILSLYLPAEPHQHRFAYTKYRKPYLNGNPIFFNVSHSEEFALIGIHQTADLGVDIEFVRPMDDMAALVNDVFSIQEEKDWHSYPQEHQPWAFFAGWTRKEAVVKAIGQGLSMPLKSFAVELEPTAKQPQASFNHLFLHSFVPHSQFMAAIACEAQVSRLITLDWRFDSE